MKKYLNKQFAKKLLLTGGATYVVSVVLNLVTLMNVYGENGDCMHNLESCPSDINQMIAAISQYIGYAGVGIFVVGLVFLIISQSKKSK